MLDKPTGTREFKQDRNAVVHGGNVIADLQAINQNLALTSSLIQVTPDLK
jgi:hypothetical protein